MSIVTQEGMLIYTQIFQVVIKFAIYIVAYCISKCVGSIAIRQPHGNVAAIILESLLYNFMLLLTLFTIISIFESEIIYI